MDIRPLIDSTLLKAEATHQDIGKLCREACQFGFAAVCVNPFRLPLVVKMLEGSAVAACTVAAFPLGAMTPSAKAEEVERALEMGADEVDMVLNIGAVKDGDFTGVAREINLAVNKVAKGRGLLKVIAETALLNRDELQMVCRIAREEGVDFIKTSTGFSSRGASREDVRLIRAFAGEDIRIKASGGIRDYQYAVQLIQEGADRLGVSNAANLVRDYLQE
ncbi:MAG: deoxyribose-phosphate aldolase [Syntrophomonadaceae bacterium]|nr:deoxyribose-phosphate aldolase [Syntrophomonadaceae bacterium]